MESELLFLRVSCSYTVEPLYCGHLGKCPVYSGTPLLWTPWEVSCIQWNPSIVDTLGSVLYTVESLYCEHLGKCPVYSGTPLLWTPWEVSCIQWNPSIVDTLGSVLYTVEPLYCGHLGKCPVYSGAPLLWTPWEVSCIRWSPTNVMLKGDSRLASSHLEINYAYHCSNPQQLFQWISFNFDEIL